MKKVKFKKWIPSVKDEERPGYFKKGTNCWDEDFTHEGVFHQWANAYEEFESGAGNYTIALVELENGQMVEVLPMNIKFIN